MGQENKNKYAPQDDIFCPTVIFSLFMTIQMLPQKTD